MGYDNQKSVWVIGNGRVMGYQYEIPAYRLGKLKNLCVIKEYGLNGVWVISESTVCSFGSLRCGDRRSFRRFENSAETTTAGTIA